MAKKRNLEKNTVEETKTNSDISQMNKNDYRKEGRYLTATDITDRLMPDLNINEALLWSPDLFAVTSYILAKTSAYQLVVSPPSKKNWQPNKEEFDKWLCDDHDKNIRDWFDDIKNAWEHDENIEFFYLDNKFANFEDWKKYICDKISKWNVNDISPVDKIDPSDSKNPRTMGDWEALVRKVGNEWRKNIESINDGEFGLIDDNDPPHETRKGYDDEKIKEHKKKREPKLLANLLKFTPPLLLACWTFFYKQINEKNFAGKKCPLQITDLLCNQDHLQKDEKKTYLDELWKVAQSLLTMHAIADIASQGFGIAANVGENKVLKFAEKLLIGRIKYSEKTKVGGSLSTFNNERCRVLPKRHNPGVGITLRSLSSNLAFNQSAVDVVWRKTQNNGLGDRFTKNIQEDNNANKLTILLLPFPLTIKAKDFKGDLKENDSSQTNSVKMPDKYGFFSYDPVYIEEEEFILNESKRIIKLIKEANRELLGNLGVDIILLPETSLSLKHFEKLQERLTNNSLSGLKKIPSIIIAGVRESQKELSDEMKKWGVRDCEAEDFNFPRNAVYCQYFDRNPPKKKKKEINKGDMNETGNENKKDEIVGKYYNGKDPDSEVTPKYKQYKHHRWQLDISQIRSYGLSSVLDTDKIWWELIKIPKRRVSFLNVGNKITISHLICEDLARQDPIAELVRHVGPSLVVAILMDGPQLKSRWSSRYATVLSDDPGCSVITLTSLGMIKRYQSGFRGMSRVIALWNDSSTPHSREIELAQGAEAVLLTLTLDEEKEKTADGRVEQEATSVVKLNDVIQIYPPEKK